jgi:hypothetical protein
MDPQLRKLGLATSLVKGVPSLTSPHQICKQGQTLTAEQAQLLKLIGEQMAYVLPSPLPSPSSLMNNGTDKGLFPRLSAFCRLQYFPSPPVWNVVGGEGLRPRTPLDNGGRDRGGREGGDGSLSVATFLDDRVSFPLSLSFLHIWHTCTTI